MGDVGRCDRCISVGQFYYFCDKLFHMVICCLFYWDKSRLILSGTHVS